MEHFYMVTVEIDSKPRTFEGSVETDIDDAQRLHYAIMGDVTVTLMRDEGIYRPKQGDASRTEKRIGAVLAYHHEPMKLDR